MKTAPSTALDAMVRDARLGVRRLLRDWRFTTAAVLILGLGIGVNTALFSVVNAALFRQSPFANSDRLVEVYQNDRDGRPAANSYSAYLDIAEQRDIFASVAATFVPSPVSYMLGDTSLGNAVLSGIAEHATPSYLDVVGLGTTLGRWFTDAENTPGAPAVVVLGHRLWTTRFQADPLAISRTIRIQGVPATVVGVAPASLRASIDVGVVTDLWLPIGTIPSVYEMPQLSDLSLMRGPLLVKGRLREGRTVA